MLTSPSSLEQINNQDRNGQTPLHFAITLYLNAQANNDIEQSRRTLDTIRILLSAGADANIADNAGNTARDLAPELIQALIIEQQEEELAAAGL
jgi:ankyrin repeat protein